MKHFLNTILIALFLTGSPTQAGDTNPQANLQKLRGQLISAVEEDIAQEKNLEPMYVSSIKKITENMKTAPANPLKDSDLSRLSAYLSSDRFSQKTKDALRVYQDELKSELESRKEKFFNEFKTATAGFVRRAMTTEDPEALQTLAAEVGEFKNKFLSNDLRDSRISSNSTSSLDEFINSISRFHTSRTSENLIAASNSLSSLERAANDMKAYVTTDEVKEFMARTRKSIGIIPPKETDALIQKTLNDLLDDKNQDRLEEIAQLIQKNQRISGYNSSSEYQSQSLRWGRLHNFANTLQQSLQRVKNGGISQISTDQWTGSESGYPILMKKDELVAKLKSYRVNVTDSQKNVTQERIYYDAKELRALTDELVTQLFDDANQNQLDEIQQKIKKFRSYCGSSSSSEFTTVSQRLQQLEYYSSQLAQSVRRIQDGGASQVNIEQWLQYNSEYGSLMKRPELMSTLGKYKVRITDGKNTLKEVPIYQDPREILGRINRADDIEKELQALSQAGRSSYDSNSGNLSTVAASLTQFAEIHANLKSGDSFVVPTTPLSTPTFGEYPNNSMQSDTRITAKLEQLRNEIERAMIQRMFPAIEIPKTTDRNTMIRAIQKQFVDAQNYEALLTLGRLVMYFTPKKTLLVPQEMLAIQQYTDGLRQQEQLGDFRIATTHFQRAAAARSTIIPVGNLKNLLQTLKKDHPEDYAKGTDDFVGTPQPASSMYNASYPHSLTLPALVVPAR